MKRKTKAAAVKKLKKSKRPAVAKLKEKKLKTQGKACQIKISLKGISPDIWRRFAVPADMSLHDVSKVIIEVMGWSGAHLYAYHIGDCEYSVPSNEFILNKKRIDAGRVLLKDALKEKQRCEFIYDFGDDWRHELVVEKIMEADPKMEYPVCLDGERACPPEDCGSVPGYEELGEALDDPDHERHEELSELAGDYNPEEFDIQEVNARIRSINYQDDKLCPE